MIGGRAKSEQCQRFKMELFGTIVNGWKSVTIIKVKPKFVFKIIFCECKIPQD